MGKLTLEGDQNFILFTSWDWVIESYFPSLGQLCKEFLIGLLLLGLKSLAQSGSRSPDFGTFVGKQYIRVTTRRGSLALNILITTYSYSPWNWWNNMAESIHILITWTFNLFGRPILHECEFYMLLTWLLLWLKLSCTWMLPLQLVPGSC